MEWLAALLLIPFAVPTVLGFVTMCCCEAVADCGGCTAGTVPDQVQITWTGIADNGGLCSGDCANLNMTHTLDLTGTTVSCSYQEDPWAEFDSECAPSGDDVGILFSIAGGSFGFVGNIIIGTATRTEVEMGGVAGGSNCSTNTWSVSGVDSGFQEFCDWSTASASVVGV